MIIQPKTNPKHTLIMKKKLFTISFLLLSLTAFSQKPVSDSMIIEQLRKEIWILKVETRAQKAELAAHNESLNLLRAELETERKNLSNLAESLGVQITNAQISADQQIQGVQQKISQNTLYWVIIALIIALLSVVLFVLLRKKQQSDKTAMIDQLSDTKTDMIGQLSDTKTDVIGQLSHTKMDMIRQLSQTKSSIEENLAKEVGKQTELIDEAMELIKKQKEKPAVKKKTKPQEKSKVEDK